MKRHLLLGAAAAALMSAPAMAGERFEAGVLTGELSANVTLTSDYIFRGISQTNEGPAIQGGFDYVTDLGFYVGTWASNVTADSGNIEIDFYGGYSNNIYFEECFDKGALEPTGCGTPVLTYDVGVIYYAYPDTDDDGVDDVDFLEVYGKLGLDFDVASIGGGLYYSDDAFGADEESLYYYGEVAIPFENVIGYPVSIDGRLGYYDYESVAGGSDDYTEWEIGLNVTALTLDWRVAYTDTDISPDSGNTDGSVYVSVGKSF